MFDRGIRGIRHRAVGRRIAAVCGALTLLLGLPAAAEPAPAEAVPQLSAGFEQAAAADGAVLYVNRETAEIAVYHAADGLVWYSNPQDRDADPVALGTAKSALGAQVSIEYRNAQGQSQSMDSYNDSVALDQHEVTVTDGVVTAAYTLGEIQLTEDDLPAVLSAARFEELCGKLDEEGRREFESRYERLVRADYDDAEWAELLATYPKLTDGGLYERGRIPSFVVPKLYALLEEAGYTQADLARDNAENGVQVTPEPKVQFGLTITYRLDGGDLVAAVDCASLRTAADTHLTTIRLLPYFGAGGAAETGALLVPDGCGSLIRFNNGKTTAAPFAVDIYGADYGVKRDALQRLEQGAIFPVFGILKEQGAVLGIVEQGDGIARVAADIAGRDHAYNVAAAQFLICAEDVVSLSGTSEASRMTVYQPEAYAGAVGLRYRFVAPPDNTYAGLAAAYRTFLLATGQLQKQPDAGDLRLNLEIYGAVETQKRFLGIPYTGLEALTTYEQAADILTDLQEAGVDAVALRYTGWLSGGVRHDPPNRLRLEGALGSTAAFRSLLEQAQTGGNTFYGDVALLEVYGTGNGFSPKRDGTRLVNGDVARLYTYDPVTYYRSAQSPFRYMANAARLLGTARDFAAGAENLGIGGASLRDAGRLLAGDYAVAAMRTRQDAIADTRAAVRALAEAGLSLMVAHGNLYALRDARAVVELPSEDSRFHITDESVPFVPIVLKGIVAFSGPSINLAEDRDEALLRAVETGAMPAFTVMAAGQDVLRDTDYNTLFSVSYDKVRGRLIAAYDAVRAVQELAGGSTIAGHETTAAGLRVTTYENGGRVVVNATDNDAAYNGRTVAARGYALFPG